MKILILGGTGMLGPWVIKALKNKHEILLTDIKSPPKNFDGEMERKKKKVLKNLQEWELVEDEVTGYKYYKHPYSKTKFGVIRSLDFSCLRSFLIFTRLYFSS